MNIETIANLVTNQGVSVVMLGVLCWYIYKQDIRHREEVNKLSEAVSNNTLVLQKLVDLLDRKE